MGWEAPAGRRVHASLVEMRPAFPRASQPMYATLLA
jgi:hypothetical protein